MRDHADVLARKAASDCELMRCHSMSVNSNLVQMGLELDDLFLATDAPYVINPRWAVHRDYPVSLAEFERISEMPCVAHKAQKLFAITG